MSFYVVRMDAGDGCGHQHGTQVKAHNCALNQLRRRRNLDRVSVVKIKQAVTRIIETTMEVINRDNL